MTKNNLQLASPNLRTASGAPSLLYGPILKKLTSQNEVDAALYLESLPISEAVLLFRMLPKELAAELFPAFPPIPSRLSSTPSPTGSCLRSWTS